MKTPTLGLIVPPAAGRVPIDGQALYAGRDVRFIARGLALPAISPEGFDTVVDRILQCGVELRDAGAQAISLMGTSLSFYRGADFTDALRDRMHEATGLPCTTMSHAIIASLRWLGIERVAVATAYIDTLNHRLVAYLASRGITVTHIEGLSITDVDAVGQVPAETLMALAERTVAAAPSAQGLLISCGGLLTLDLHVPLEDRLGLPVTSSSPAGFWDLMRAAGLDASSPGYGQLFAAERALERAA
ncbi:Arylmalonate decarboxylase [Variovorax sp. SRS16]|uniref:arylmalonate decarboxylase n=1 Tax=Variovorax sp. SRS16 TaxID=282217 RepID=UPI0013186266|nr:arylmalonate decarboxylase [Variovorax sp. SRS16]VTU27606.1 Arylmalonate decarboxylase [Variovorax sp. SRS16]